MSEWVNSISIFLSSNENAGFITILSFLIFMLTLANIILIRDRFKLIKKVDQLKDYQLQEKNKENKSLTEIVNTYHNGNLKLVESLNDINSVLISIQNNRK